MFAHDMSKKSKESLKQLAATEGNDEDVVPDLPPSRYASNASLSKRPGSVKSLRSPDKEGTHYDSTAIDEKAN